MSLLELGDKQFTIPVGEIALGSDPSCAISLTGSGILPRHAVLQGQADGQVVIRKASPAADVLINGVRLGAEPTPLLHGDKIEVGGQELTFVDERRSGSTQYVEALNLPQGAQGGGGRGTTAKPVGTTGGRVVSLTDGREYVITGPSLVFGREAGSDVVVPGKDVSRRHAEIVQTPRGYLLVDSSTNGTFVTEERVQGQRLLARADVIRIGEEQFRFYADAAPAVASPPPSPPSPPPPGPAASAPLAEPPPAGAPPPAPGASERLKHTVHGLEAASARQSPGGALASFLVRSGALKGQRLQVKTPVANIGRADYNDLVIPDPSVSTNHAKLQRREGVWVLVDLESTNGTFVDGEPVKADAPLAPGASVRFGDVQLVFEPTDDAVSVVQGGGTQVIAGVRTPTMGTPPAPKPAPAPAPTARPQPPLAPPKPAAKPGPKPAPKPAPKVAPKRPAAQQPPPKKGKGCGASAAVLVVGGAGLVALLHRLLA